MVNLLRLTQLGVSVFLFASTALSIPIPHLPALGELVHHDPNHPSTAPGTRLHGQPFHPHITVGFNAQGEPLLSPVLHQGQYAPDRHGPSVPAHQVGISSLVGHGHVLLDPVAAHPHAIRPAPGLHSGKIVDEDHMKTIQRAHHQAIADAHRSVRNAHEDAQEAHLDAQYEHNGVAAHYLAHEAHPALPAKLHQLAAEQHGEHAAFHAAQGKLHHQKFREANRKAGTSVGTPAKITEAHAIENTYAQSSAAHAGHGQAWLSQGHARAALAHLHSAVAHRHAETVNKHAANDPLAPPANRQWSQTLAEGHRKQAKGHVMVAGAHTPGKQPRIPPGYRPLTPGGSMGGARKSFHEAIYAQASVPRKVYAPKAKPPPTRFHKILNYGKKS
ncbi:hypothetical protein CVT26_005705 [Gymnopilus dilepis]|uniref:Uncharacterized protein n=1 Tax=Gymnopilus dilepis TaxID=231916 RepID=A0A409WK44_9AGAR|nr:hypothetical protein CVT26_005705 [Gymnopilus dilepis]